MPASPLTPDDYELALQDLEGKLEAFILRGEGKRNVLRREAEEALVLSEQYPRRLPPAPADRGPGGRAAGQGAAGALHGLRRPPRGARVPAGVAGGTTPLNAEVGMRNSE